MRARWIFPLAVAPLVMATSCPVIMAVQVFPQASLVDPPVFMLWNASDSSGAVGALEVRECAADGAVMWRITRQGRAIVGSQRVVYGEAPADFGEAAPARPLARGGCYRALAQPVDPLVVMRLGGVELLAGGPRGQRARLEPHFVVGIVERPQRAAVLVMAERLGQVL